MTEKSTGTPPALQRQLEEKALSLGADYFGVADLTQVEAFVRRQGGEMIAQFPRALSIGVVMPFDIVDQLPRHQERAVALAYGSHSWNILNHRLDHIASRLSSILQREGYRAFPIQTSQTVDEEQLYGHISHKLAAHLAGLGWIGKSCLLVTPEVGPRLRWATVLTDAPLEAGEPMQERCGECEECVTSCPAGAFTGRSFDPSESREARFDVYKCDAYLSSKERAEEQFCGMCVYACPHGKGAQ